MTLPRRIRILRNCFDLKYKQVATTLASDKEMRDLIGLRNRIEKYYEKEATQKV